MRPCARRLTAVVVERLAEPGDMAMPGKPLVRLYDENALRVELQVPEELARDDRAGHARLRCSVDATGAEYHTQVSEIVPASDPASRSFLVRAPLPSGGHLQPGMFARATFAAGSETVLTIPRDAVERVGQLETVRVYSAGRIRDPDGLAGTPLRRSGRGAGRASAGRARDPRPAADGRWAVNETDRGKAGPDGANRRSVPGLEPFDSAAARLACGRRASRCW